MPAFQIVHGRGAYTRRPRRVRNVATGEWLAAPVTAFEPPEWTSDRTNAWLGLPVAALRQLDILKDAHGIEADMD